MCMGMIITLQLGGTLHIAPHESVIFLKTLLVFHLLHLGNPLLNDQTPRRSSCGCGFQQLTALLCKACDCSIDFLFSQSGLLLLVLLWDFCSYWSSSGFQAHAGEMRWSMVDLDSGLESEAWCSIPSFAPYWWLDFSQPAYFFEHLFLVMFKSCTTTIPSLLISNKIFLGYYEVKWKCLLFK